MIARLFFAATAVFGLAACQPHDAQVRPGYGHDAHLGVPQPDGEPNAPDRTSTAPPQDWDGIEEPRRVIVPGDT